MPDYMNPYGAPMPYYNNMSDYVNNVVQQRMAQVQAQNPQLYNAVMNQYNPMPQQQPTQQVYPPKSMLVTSAKEAESQNVLDGFKYVFVNTSNDEIYTRQFDVKTGTAPVIVYRRVIEEQIEPQNVTTPPETAQIDTQTPDDVTMLKEQLNALTAKYNELEERLNVQSNGCGQCTCKTKSASSNDDTTVAADAAAGNEPRTNTKSNDTSKSAKSNVAKS